MEALRWISMTTALTSVVWAEHPVVDTQYGRLKGVEMTSNASRNSVMAFLGVPYAQPPVGDLRFALPQPVSHWEGIRDATQHCAACPQDETVFKGSYHPIILSSNGQSEDCLYLDVYTPGVDGQRPVLVVIHGGGFIFGTNTLLVNGAPLAATEDIVVVSLNYRLGALGNLYNAEGAWPSNLGLRDQQFALRWVQDNIAAFGGDPDRVTLNGEVQYSSVTGSISVSAQILAPSSRGLFHRAIAQSGSIFSFITAPENPQIVADKLTASLGCPTKQLMFTLKCLKKKSVEEILDAQATVLTKFTWDQVWDGDFLPSDPFKAYSEGEYSKVDMISGFTSNEGFILVPFLIPELLTPAPDSKLVEEQVTTAVGLLLGHTGFEDEVVKYVLGDIEDKGSDWLGNRVSDIVAEYTLQASTYLAVKLHSGDVANTYLYEFAHKPSFMTGLRPPWHRGCDHAMDLVFSFGLPFVDDFQVESSDSSSQEERVFSRVVMKYIANFVKTGSPNSEGLMPWVPFSVSDANYQILQPKIENGKNFKAEAMEFWGEKTRDLGKFDVQGLKRDEL